MVFRRIRGRSRRAAALVALVASLFLAAAGAGALAEGDAGESCAACTACERGECGDGHGPDADAHHCCATSCLSHAQLTLSRGLPAARPVPLAVPPAALPAGNGGVEPDTPHEPPRR